MSSRLLIYRNFIYTKPKNCAAGPSESPKIQAEKLDEIKTSFRKELMSDLTKIPPENKKGMVKLKAPVVTKTEHSSRSGEL